ncbi:MAG: hypothetical protein ACR2FZ_09600, partial [Thermoleophilaceae bacterium]
MPLHLTHRLPRLPGASSMAVLLATAATVAVATVLPATADARPEPTAKMGMRGPIPGVPRS